MHTAGTSGRGRQSKLLNAFCSRLVSVVFERSDFQNSFFSHFENVDLKLMWQEVLLRRNICTDWRSTSSAFDFLSYVIFELNMEPLPPITTRHTNYDQKREPMKVSEQPVLYPFVNFDLLCQLLRNILGSYTYLGGKGLPLVYRIHCINAKAVKLSKPLSFHSICW